MAQLSGTGLLADDLYLMAHNDVSGKPYLQPRALGLGLAGALLAELMLTGNVRIRHGEIVVTDLRPPGEGLAGFVLSLVISEPERHPAQSWLGYLARTAAPDVARRLEQSGYLARATGRPWRPQRWVPVDPDCAFAPVSRVQSALRPSRPVTVASTVLAGLAAACGLGSRLQMCGPPNGLRSLDQAVQQLQPHLRDLIAATQAAVDSAVLSHRV